MARHGDTRSPSPVGSSYSASASKRHHRDDDRYERSRRDDGRGHRHRSRTRSPDVRYTINPYVKSNLCLVQKRYRDRDSRHHRDRSRDRYRDDDGYRSSRRDRSRDRRKSRDRDAVKDYRRRSRDRDSRSYRDDSRERARRRREGSADSRRKGRRDDSRDRNHKATGGKEVSSTLKFFVRDRFTERNAQTTMTAAQTDEEKKAERLAKLEAWKQKQAAEKDRKQKELESSGGTRNLLAEIDKKAQGSPAIASPVVASPVSPSTPAVISGDASPVPYAGKFDPKALSKKKPSASSNASKLGTDIALPEIAKASATIKPTANGLKADKTSALGNGSSGASLPVLVNVSDYS